MNGLLASGGPSAYWYLTRSSGAMALLLLTGAVALGVLDVKRFSSERWPRFLIDGLHRNVSLLAMAFLALHIVTAVLDSFASISLLDAVVPFAGSYRPLWLGLGALSFDLLVAVAITSMLRQRIGYAGWRAVHWLTYASWPIALLHGLGTGSDVKSAWMLALSVACIAVVAVAVLARVLSGWQTDTRRRVAALAGTGAFALFLLVWLPSGPLGSEWARRSGTPSSLLGHSSSSAKTAGRASTQSSTRSSTREGESEP
ncbi:MAG TPA: ferric reductase-like transmembrane domain-containing protein [Solirubrobacteraceae bacterium]|nr:ferric reductase-like transmembrane domain-containing protein [Solirubrobacteraceae bacterium]